MIVKIGQKQSDFLVNYLGWNVNEQRRMVLLFLVIHGLIDDINSLLEEIPNDYKDIPYLNLANLVLHKLLNTYVNDLN